MNTKMRAIDLLQKEVGPPTFGMFLRAARTSLDLTQTEMAKKLGSGVTKSMISDIERGRQLVSPKLALRVAKKAKNHHYLFLV